MLFNCSLQFLLKQTNNGGGVVWKDVKLAEKSLNKKNLEKLISKMSRQERLYQYMQHDWAAVLGVYLFGAWIYDGYFPRGEFSSVI